jgi:hypothetical protein
MNGFIPFLPFLIFLIIGLVIQFPIVGWCCDDTHRRGKSAIMVCIAALFFFPWGLIFRPDPIGPEDG